MPVPKYGKRQTSLRDVVPGEPAQLGPAADQGGPQSHRTGLSGEGNFFLCVESGALPCLPIWRCMEVFRELVHFRIL